MTDPNADPCQIVQLVASGVQDVAPARMARPAPAAPRPAAPRQEAPQPDTLGNRHLTTSTGLSVLLRADGRMFVTSLRGGSYQPSGKLRASLWQRFFPKP